MAEQIKAVFETNPTFNFRLILSDSKGKIVWVGEATSKAWLCNAAKRNGYVLPSRIRTIAIN